MKNLESWKQEEKIKISYLKNGGNILEVAKELNLPLDYVKKISEKLKKRDDRNVSSLVANNIAQYILMGYEGRKLHYLKSLQLLDQAANNNKLSVCCESPVKLLEESVRYGHEDYECLLCHEKCEIKIVTFGEIVRIKKELLEQMRLEDELLIKLGEKMGYSNTAPAPVIKDQRKIVVIGDNKSDSPVVEEITQLSPKDRDRLLDRLNAEIATTAEKVNDKQELQTNTDV